jgi:hypothetical protein
VKKSSHLMLFAVVVLLSLTSVACNRESASSGQVTETIAPAAPQPEPTGTDAMTQTVDIETGRSASEGGGLTTDTTDSTVTAATTTDTTGTPPPATSTR